VHQFAALREQARLLSIKQEGQANRVSGTLTGLAAIRLAAGDIGLNV
jgi:hypothetical protein